MQNTERFRYDLKEKSKNFRDFLVSVLPYNQDRKLGNLEHFVHLEY